MQFSPVAVLDDAPAFDDCDLYDDVDLLDPEEPEYDSGLRPGTTGNGGRRLGTVVKLQAVMQENARLMQVLNYTIRTL